MKKLISFLAVIAMLFTFTAIPAMAADLTVNFESEDNLAYGCPVSHISGTYYTSGRVTPSSAPYILTDGKVVNDDKTAEYYSYKPGTAVAFQLNLGDVYALEKVAIYTKSSRTLSIYMSTTKEYESGTLIANVKGVDGKVNGATCAELAVSLESAVPAQYVTFVQSSGSATYWYEVYVAGSSADSMTDADKVAADKKALDLDDTTAVTGNLTLPTSGSAYGSTITWETSDASVITADGKITRVGEDKTATLTATITSGDVTDTKEFTVTVSGYEVYNLDLSAENNILLGKTITPIAGRYYNTSAPNASRQLATDGDITTQHYGNGKLLTGEVTGLVFSVNLEKEYFVDNVKVLLAKNHSNYTVKIYNGSAVDESKLIGTYSAPGTANYVVSGEQEEALVVLSCDLPEFTRASQLTIAYEAGTGNDFIFHEIAATGSEVEEGVTYINFKSSNNLAYGKDNAFAIGHYLGGYSGAWTPATDDLATDSYIDTTKKANGRYAGAGEGDGYGFAFAIDLGAYYNLSEITLYTTTKLTYDLVFHSEKGYTKTNNGNSSSKGGYMLNSQGGILPKSGGFATAVSATETTKINGVDVYANTATIPANAEPVRYLIVHYAGGGEIEYNELYVAGTTATGLSFAEADSCYVADEEAGTKTVKAKVALMNNTDAVTSGIIYYAAYNEDGALVGMTTATITELAAGATYETPVTFSVTDAVKNVKAFYWTGITFVPIITDIDFT